MAGPNQKQDSSERVLGKLEEFKDWAKDRFDEIDNKFDTIHKEIEILNKIKWQIYGGAAVVSTAFAIILELLRSLIRVKA